MRELDARVALSPTEPVALVGHDYGAQLAYPAMARAAHRSVAPCCSPAPIRPW